MPVKSGGQTQLQADGLPIACVVPPVGVPPCRHRDDAHAAAYCCVSGFDVFTGITKLIDRGFSVILL